MKNIILRLIIFLSAAILSVVIPFLALSKLSDRMGISIAFLILAEALNIFPLVNFRDKSFPFHLLLRLFLFPAYFTGTLILVCCSSLLSSNWLLIIELLLLFPVIAGICIAAMERKPRENQE